MEGVAFTLADARDCLAAAGDAARPCRTDRRRREERALEPYDRRRARREIVRYRGGETGPAFGAARLARLAATGESPDALCRAPEILDVTAPEPVLADAFASAARAFRRASIAR